MTEADFLTMTTHERRVLVTSHFGYFHGPSPETLLVAGRMYAHGYGFTLEGPGPPDTDWAATFHRTDGPRPDAGTNIDPATATVIGALRALGVIAGSS